MRTTRIRAQRAAARALAFVDRNQLLFNQVAKRLEVVCRLDQVNRHQASLTCKLLLEQVFGIMDDLGVMPVEQLFSRLH